MTKIAEWYGNSLVKGYLPGGGFAVNNMPKVLNDALAPVIPNTLGAVTDNFDDGVIDTAKWVTETDVGGSGNVTIAETNGQLRITPPVNYGGLAYSGLISAAAKALTASGMWAHVVQPTNNVPSVETYMEARKDSDHGFIISLIQGTLGFAYQNGAYRTIKTYAYDSNDHAWWRIREDAGIVYFDTAAVRDPMRQPFAHTSIWNTPIGADAVYVDAGMVGVPQPGVWTQMPYGDEDHIVMTPTEPMTAVNYTNVGWSGGNRCAATGGLLTTVPLPASYIAPNSNGNDTLAALLPDARTIVEAQPFARCTAGQPGTATFLSSPPQDIYGDGIRGGRGGSGMSGLGGTLRVGELRPGDIGVKHALKVNVYAKQFLFRATTAAQAYRWPAQHGDAYAVGHYGTEAIGTNGTLGTNSNTAMKMGALLAIPDTVNLATLGLETEPGEQLAWTLQNYGAYIVDDTWAPGFGIAVENGPDGNFKTQFQADYGFAFNANTTVDTAWMRDMKRLVEALFVVDNNSATSIGGGGTPLQPATAPLPTPGSPGALVWTNRATLDNSLAAWPPKEFGIPAGTGTTPRAIPANSFLFSTYGGVPGASLATLQTAFANMFAAIKAAGGGTATIGAGTYDFGNTGVNTTFVQVDDLVNCRIVATGALFRCNSTANVTPNMFVFGNPDNVTIDGMQFKDLGGDRNVNWRGAICIIVQCTATHSDFRTRNCSADTVTTFFQSQQDSNRYSFQGFDIEATVTNSYYGCNPNYTGRHSRANLVTTNVRRAFIGYGIQNFDITVDHTATAGPGSNALVELAPVVGYQVADVNVYLTARGALNNYNALVSFYHQSPATEVGYAQHCNVKFTMDAPTSYASLGIVCFTSEPPGTGAIQPTTVSKWQNITVHGSFTGAYTGPVIGNPSVSNAGDNKIFISDALSSKVSLSGLPGYFTFTTIPISLAAMKAVLGAGSYGMQAAPGTAIFEDYNAGSLEASPPVDWTIANHGVNSSHARTLYAGTDGVHPPWTTQMAASAADTILITFGTLDQFDRTPDEFQADIEALVDVAQANGKKVILTSFPRTQDGNYALYNARIPTIATSRGAAFYDLYAAAETLIASSSFAAAFPDGYHGTDATYLYLGTDLSGDFIALVDSIGTGGSDMQKIEDRVCQVSTSTGTGNMTLGAAITAHRTFAQANIAVGDTFYGCIAAVDANGVETGDWETGYYTYSAVNTVARTTVRASSNNNAAVNFAAGTKHVTLTLTAYQFQALVDGLGGGTTTPPSTLTPYGQDASLYGPLGFQDEFDGVSLDRNKWNAAAWYDPFWPNGRPQTNYDLSGGKLRIWPQNINGQFFDREINTDGKWYPPAGNAYGFWEFEAKLPVGAGCWPALWMLGHDTAQRPEIDLMEAYPGAPQDTGWNDANWHPNNYGATTWNDSSAVQSQAGATTLQNWQAPLDLSLAMHKYGCRVDSTGVQHYFDGVALGPKHLSNAFNQRMYAIIDLWFHPGLDAAASSVSGPGIVGSGVLGPSNKYTPEGPTNAFEIGYFRWWPLKA